MNAAEPLRIAAFDNRYARLPPGFFVRQRPTPVAQPRLLVFNHALAGALGLRLDGLDDQALAALFSGNVLAEGSDPLAMAYAGHQFGSFVPQLGDGRAILLGEILDRDGRRRDLQLKGAGRTPYSRRGDGRAALGPVLREYLLSEHLHALGIPATRALAAVATGETVLRERPLPGAILTRVAASHIRVGTFQFLRARGDLDGLRQLADHVIDRHYPQVRDQAQPYRALLRAVAQAQAALVAQWLSVGFVHGVMNTDNMAVSGETIDFGPCAFLEHYDPDAVFSAIDEGGRYAYSRQGPIAQWNILCLAEALLPLLDAQHERAVDSANEEIGAFAPAFEALWLERMRAKLGLARAAAGDAALVDDWLALLYAARADFTLSFRELCAAAADPNEAGPRARCADAAAYDRWILRWRQRLQAEERAPAECARAMRACNPAYIARNHRVEQALDAAIERGDLAPFHRLLAVLSRPYEEQAESAAYALAAAPGEAVLRTFCGT